MSSQYRSLNPSEATGPDTPTSKRSFLPPAGLERKFFLALVVIIMAVKAITIIHFRADADETQHAHVVWEWASGHLQYRDVFDNHMPLFQMLCAPFMALIGPQAQIMIWLRILMLPIYAGCLWCIFRLAEELYSPRIAPWLALAAGALPKFFYTSTEFRPDDLWAFLWLFALLVAVTGKFRTPRAFIVGLIIGLTFATSLKTVVLSLSLLTAVIIALPFAWARREGPGPLQIFSRLGVYFTRLAAILAGAIIPPAAVVLYFKSKYAYWIMYYCVILHNIVPKMKRWGHFDSHLGIFPVTVLLMAAVAWLIARQPRDTQLAMRRIIITIMPWLFLAFLLSYWPDITREDDLPYTPLTPFLAVPFIILLRQIIKTPNLEAKFFTWVLPAVCFAEMLCVWNVNPLRTDRLKNTSRSIADVLKLTDPGDYVMDGRGDYIFRQRPTYWVYETITKARMRDGLIPDHLQQELVNTDTTISYLFAAHVSQNATMFIMTNYIPFDPQAIDLAVAGKQLGNPGPNQTYNFIVSIPATYAVVSETGTTSGLLDGKPYNNALLLKAGQHTFQRTAGTGRAAIFLNRALENGYKPLFDVSENFLKKEKLGKNND
jgi:hypothetical protein